MEEGVANNGESNGLLDKASSTVNDDNDYSPEKTTSKPTAAPLVSRTGLMVLLLLAVQNCSKNLLMRSVMKEQPKLLPSAAVIGSEFLKLTGSVCFIVFYQGKSFQSILQYLKDDHKNTLLVLVPASAYNLQMSLEYVALANLSAAMFSVLVQSKLVFTATFAAVLLRKQLTYMQVISLLLLTVGVVLCNMNSGGGGGSDGDTGGEGSDGDTGEEEQLKGILATLGIAVSSGFASVYTEKVIKAQRRPEKVKEYGLAYTQVQLAFMSLVSIGGYAVLHDWHAIWTNGLFYNFSFLAFCSVLMSASGGLIVATVLKYADSVLKGYATAMSVVMTGILSMLLFGTHLSVIYFMGIINVVVAVMLYNGKDLDQFICKKQ